MSSLIWRSGEPANRSLPNAIQPTQLALEETIDFNRKSIEILGLPKSELELHFADMTQESNRRDKMNGKLTNRNMIQQTSQNPFLVGTNYVNDLQVQEQFLRPKSSHTEIKELPY